MATTADPRSNVQAPPWWRRTRHSFAHFWPRVAVVYVPDLWIRLPQSGGGDRVAALTFDDGPTDAGTPQLLDLLNRHQIRATFFLSGENVRRFPGRAREIVAAGHALGNHFREHLDCWSASPRAVIREVTEGSRIIEDVTGVSPAWCRPPFGRLTHAIVKWSRVHRQQIVLWDVFPADYLEHTTPADLASVLHRKLKHRSIVCLHDNAVSQVKTPEMLRQVLPRLCDTGWKFVALPEKREGVEARSRAA